MDFNNWSMMKNLLAFIVIVYVVRVESNSIAKRGCPKDAPVVTCFKNPCDKAKCDKYPLAKCKTKPCNPCSEDFFLGGKKVDCTANSTPCRKFCTWLYEPVCGSDGKTYDNRCELNNAIKCGSHPVRFSSLGECRAIPQPCPRTCPLLLNPVCGSDGRVYINPCDLKKEKECNGRSVEPSTFSPDGTCAV